MLSRFSDRKATTTTPDTYYFVKKFNFLFSTYHAGFVGIRGYMRAFRSKISQKRAKILCEKFAQLEIPTYFCTPKRS